MSPQITLCIDSDSGEVWRAVYAEAGGQQQVSFITPHRIFETVNPEFDVSATGVG